MAMKVEFRESFFYEAWIVASDFGTQNSYRIYVKVLDPGRPEIPGKQTGRPANLFANKHLRDDPAAVLRKRTFKRISKLNPQNQVSFDVNHCAGAVSA